MPTTGFHYVYILRDVATGQHHYTGVDFFPFPTIYPAKGSFRTPKKPKILTDTNVTFRLPLDS